MVCKSAVLEDGVQEVHVSFYILIYEIDQRVKSFPSKREPALWERDVFFFRRPATVFIFRS